MRVSNIDFTDAEKDQLLQMAGRNLNATGIFHGQSPAEREAYLKSLSPANLVRAALGFQLRQTGGIREGGFEEGNQLQRLGHKARAMKKRSTKKRD